ncbi:hypothetical protein FS749_003452 [Ceratobasidium sp. UAMH 11750]|nr:hypothetical protein FS749_003452 [Ceratobasidium sp. UAMH 11750]
MSRKRKNSSDEGFSFTYTLPGPLNTTPEVPVSSPDHPPGIPTSKRPRLDPSSSSAGPSKARFAERFTKKQKTETILAYMAESNRYNLGDFLAHIFAPQPGLDPSALNSISYWLKGQSRAGTRPAEIVDAIYRHKDSIQRDEKHQVLRPSFSDLTPPIHPPWFINTQPQDVSLLPVSPDGALSTNRVNSREGLDELMVRGTLQLVEREAQLLADKDVGLMRSAGMTWDDIECLSRDNQEPAIRQQAPVIWAILSTIVLCQAGSSSAAPEVSVRGTRPGPRFRDTVPAIMIVIFMLISLRNPLVNCFQAIMAVFMFACNAHKLLYQVTNRIGLSTSHSTLHGLLGRLGQSAIAELRNMARRAWESACDPTRQPQQYFLLVFDNVNKFQLARNQTVATKNHMKNGTAATAIAVEDAEPGAFDPKPYWERIQAQARESLTVGQLLDDIDPNHLAAVGTGMVMRTLLAYIPALAARFRSELEERFKSLEGYAKHRLRLRKSTTMPMATSAIDEATAAGVSDILHDLVSTQMGMQPSWFERLLIMICGDQLTVDRLRKVIRYRATEDSTYESRSWALPIIQIWHMKLAYLHSIFKVHWFPKISSGLLGLRQAVDALGRMINPDRGDFYPCHDAVKVVFEGMVLTAAYVDLREKAGLDSGPTDHMLGELGKLFAPDGLYHDCSLDQLEQCAARIYAQYMTTDAYRRTLGAEPDDESSSADLEAMALGELECYEAQPDYTPNPVHLPTSADQLLGNFTRFMRDTFWYLELASAVPEGDMGRVFEVIKLLRFSFWGSGASNYGNELLELAASFLCEYPDPLQRAILNNYLVNPSGLPGRWQECDFFQEHSNNAIKNVFNSKNSEWDSRFLRDAVSVNIGGLARLHDTMLEFLGLGKAGRGRARPDLTADINVLASCYLREQVFRLSPGRQQECTAPDMFEDGLNKLEQGTLKQFLERTLASRAGQNFEPVAESEDQPKDIEIPPEPLIMEDGMLGAGEPNADYSGE